MASVVIPQRFNESYRVQMLEKRIEILEKYIGEKNPVDARALLLLAKQDAVKKIVATWFMVSTSTLNLKTRSRSIVHARSVAMYLMYAAEGMSYPEIGKAFGGMHHTSVMYSVKRIHEQRMVDSKLERTLTAMQLELDTEKELTA